MIKADNDKLYRIAEKAQNFRLIEWCKGRTTKATRWGLGGKTSVTHASLG